MFRNLIWRSMHRAYPIDTLQDRRSGFTPRSLFANRSGCKTAPTSFDNSLLKQVLALASLLTGLTGCLNSEHMAKEEVTLEMDTPSAGWSAEPLEAWETNEAIYCLFQLSPPKGMAAQVITKIDSSLRLPKSEKMKKLVVLGKTWNWSPSESIAFPESRDAFLASLPDNASRIEIGRDEP